MSSGEDDGYFADGLTEEILNSLARLPELLVTARTSSFHFKGRDLPIPEIAKTLGVKHIVEGSVRRSGENVRITAQLVRAEDGFHLWSDTYDRTLEDIFAVQENIAENIAETLDVVLNDDKRQVMRDAGIGNVEAFIAYQKGMAEYDRAHSLHSQVDTLTVANRWLDEALAIAPEIDDALYLRSDLYAHIIFDHAINEYEYSLVDLENATAEIRSSLSRAGRAARNDSLRALIEIELALFNDDWSSVPRFLDAAFKLGHCNPVNWAAEFTSPFGGATQVVEHQEERSRCDPLAGWPIVALVHAAIWSFQPDRGIRAADRFLERAGFQPWVDDVRFAALLASGRHVDDPGVFNPNPEGSNYDVPRAIYAYAINNEIDTARTIFEDYIASNPVDEISKLATEAVLGNRAEANRLASALDSRYGGALALSVAVHNCYCGAPFDLEATPNFKARIEEAGFPWPPPSPIKYPAKDW
jgi:TolB-like protein